MKSFSNELPNTDKLVTQEDFKTLKAQWTAVQTNDRMWMFGLAAFNLIVTIVLVFVTHH